jgi:hypothetical protein
VETLLLRPEGMAVPVLNDIRHLTYPR